MVTVRKRACGVVDRVGDSEDLMKGYERVMERGHKCECEQT